ncbi:MAG: DUF4132 domain-containing protein [Azospirillum sp.]|nr:DUF4132 domain-containing protein [Azospirillum sp.]
MVSRIHRIFGGAGGERAEPPEEASPLVRSLVALWPLWPDLTGPAHRFIMTGADPDIVGRLQGLAKNPSWTGATYRRRTAKAWLPCPIDPPLYQALLEEPIDDPAAIRRLGQLVAAAAPAAVRDKHSIDPATRPSTERLFGLTGHARWLEWLIPQLIVDDGEAAPRFVAPTAIQLADALRIDGFDLFSSLLAMPMRRVQFCAPGSLSSDKFRCHWALPGLDDLIAREWPKFSAKPSSPPGAHYQKKYAAVAVQYLVAHGCATSSCRQDYLNLLVDSRKEFHDAAMRWLPWVDGPDIDSFFEGNLAGVAAIERIRAARNWYEIRGKTVVPALKRALERERTNRVRDAIRDLLAAVGAAEGAPSAYALAIPPCSPVPEPAPIPEAARVALAAALRATREKRVAQFLGYLAPLTEGEALRLPFEVKVEKFQLRNPWDKLTFGDEGPYRIDDFFSYLEGGLAEPPWIAVQADLIAGTWAVTRFLDFVIRDDVPLGCKLRLFDLIKLSCAWWSKYHRDSPGSSEPRVTTLFKRWPVDLRVLAARFAVGGYDDHDLGWSYLKDTSLDGGVPGTFRLPPEFIWPYFAERPELLSAGLVPPVAPYIRPVRVWRILDLMPAAPESLVDAILPFVAGKDKAIRPVARRLLATHPQAQLWALDLAGRTDAESRLAGLDWLIELKNPAAVPPLLAALAAEKSDAVLRRTIEALEACGHDSSPLFDAPAQSKAAAKLLKKGVPAALSWFPWSELPAVRRRDGAGEVPCELVQAWLLEAFQAKEPRGPTILQRKLQIADQTDLAVLGSLVLKSWLAEDRRTMDPTQAAAKAAEDTERAYRFPRTCPDEPREVYQERLTRRFLGVMVSTGMASKGLLGLAALTCGPEAVGIARPVLKAYDGGRRAQILALLNMLSRISHPTAIQLVLATATRHSVRTVQEEAQALVEQIAEERGWSADELADRTIPTAGLDEDGTLNLDFGSSRFVGRLTPQLALALETAEGKPLKSLPEPRKADDPELAKAAKARFAQARKDVKLTVELQTARLYEAMCLGKSWRFDDWERDLNRHPIAGRLVQRLVWQSNGGAGGLRLFRPLEDGSLSDADDKTIVLSADDRLWLAHGAMLEEVVRRTWQQHLADYEVRKPFEQFGRVPLPAAFGPEVLGAETVISDFVGAVMTDLTVRATMNRLGYKAGPNVDGGGVVNYVKPFRSLGVSASIFISGHNAVISKDEELMVAIKEGAFIAPDLSYPSPEDGLPLAGVPAMLRAELYADLHDAAAAGTMMADWKKRVEDA